MLFVADAEHLAANYVQQRSQSLSQAAEHVWCTATILVDQIVAIPIQTNKQMVAYRKEDEDGEDKGEAMTN